MNNLYTITTPENVDFSFLIAGYGSRLLSWIIDLLFIATLILAVSYLANVLIPIGQGVSSALALAAFFLINWGYFVFWEWKTGGQSPGKKLFHLRVIQNNGSKITLFQSMIRNLLRIIDSMPVFYLVAFVSSFLSPQLQRLGDLAAGTLVIKEEKRPRPEVILPESQRYNSFLDDPYLAGKIRSQINLEERETLITICLRREELSIPVRLQLFSDLAGYCEKRLKIDRPPSLSPEKYILNITAILVR
ncbi:MAG: RDD family protein [bacterium]